MIPFVADSDFTLYVGDAAEVLRELPAESVHCVVTSPPYWGLRDYGTGSWEGGDPDCNHKKIERVMHAGRQGNATGTPPGAGRMGDEYFPDVCGKCGATRTDRQLGLEPTPEAYVESMVAVFREVRRVLRRDGTCWLNLGDSYSNIGKSGGYSGGKHVKDLHGRSDLYGRGRRTRGDAGLVDAAQPERRADGVTPAQVAELAAGTLKAKDLVGIPWRLAFALQADGWYLRSDIIWSKPNPMPESVTDRPTKAHEYLFLLTRSPRYFYDADAVRENYQHGPSVDRDGCARGPWENATEYGEARGGSRTTARGPDGRRKTTVQGQDGSSQHRDGERWPNPSGRNKRSVWEIVTEPYPDAHFATFPQALVAPCMLAGTSERGCCPECGAPWVYTPPVTLGWLPTCTCRIEMEGSHTGFTGQIPCTVLDPFMGSGTTALVARKLGRRSIGIELNPEYARLAADRLSQLSLLAEGAA